MELGGYLIHRLYPRHRLFIDNRNLSVRLLDDYLAMLASPGRFEAAARRFGFETVVLANIPIQGPLRQALAADPRATLGNAPTHTPTFTATPTASATGTITNTPTITGTATHTPTITRTPTITPIRLGATRRP